MHANLAFLSVCNTRGSPHHFVLFCFVFFVAGGGGGDVGMCFQLQLQTKTFYSVIFLHTLLQLIY